MAPLTRSSAPSSPATPRLSTGGVGLVTPTRRTPHCTKCHRPRAGHPRSGCPFVDASDQTSVPPASADDGLLEELSSLHIVSPSEERQNARATQNKSRRKLSVRFALVPEQTLASLSATDTQLVEQLLQPGMISDGVSPQDKLAHVLRWQETLDDADPLEHDDFMEHVDVQAREPKKPSSSNSATTPPLSRRMPCTLSTPTASLLSTEPATDQNIGGSALDMNETVYLLSNSNIEKARPLTRSMSCEQRSLFLHQLSNSSNAAPATLFSLPLADLDIVRSDAERLGFCVRVLPSEDDGHKWVVLGTEDEAIDLLTRRFLEEEERRGAKVERKDGKLTAVAGGVIFGAVATWTGLAFS